MRGGDLSSSYHLTRTARKILALDLGFLGDSVHLVPALWEIKQHYPQAELHTLSAPVGAEALRLAPCVDRSWAFPLASPSPPWWRHWGLILALRRECFDLAFNFSGADRSIFLTALIGARWRLALAGGRQHFWSSWFIRNWTGRPNREVPVYEQRRQMLGACGFALEAPRWDLQLPEAAMDWAEALVPTGAVHFSISASNPLKEWPLEHWIELAKRFLAQRASARLIATGSSNPREQHRLGLLAAGVGDARLAVLPSGLTIAQLAAVLRRSSLHVGADSGALHLAVALGVPTLALFRQYAGTAEWLPRGPTHKHFQVPCPCADRPNPPCAPKGTALCLAQIAPKQVLALVTEMVGKTAAANGA
jgi:ADP-heptose:LPS heptosyltransferase